MIDSIMRESTSVLRNAPQIRDVEIVGQLLEPHGVSVSHDQAEGVLTLDPTKVEQANFADIDAHAGSSRLPILFCGPLVHRIVEVFIQDLGGFLFCDRLINYHLDVLLNFEDMVEENHTRMSLT